MNRGQLLILFSFVGLLFVFMEQYSSGIYQRNREKCKKLNMVYVRGVCVKGVYPEDID